MVIDTIENLSKYVGLNPLFADVVAFLGQNDLNQLEAGKHPIKDKDLFVNITTAKGRAKEAATLETHINMIDIQIPLDTEETFGYTPLCDLPEFEYNAEKDITKYGTTLAQTYVTCKPGQMAIFFPQDGHAPCISEKEEIKKAIFKVKVV
jgi:YhcH/YjgK/YiaL family protein